MKDQSIFAKANISEARLDSTIELDEYRRIDSDLRAGGLVALRRAGTVSNERSSETASAQDLAHGHRRGTLHFG
jgi:hypothetical protein